MEYSRTKYTIGKVLFILLFSTPSFAFDLSLGVGDAIVHDHGYRMVYQRKEIAEIALEGGYQLPYGITVLGKFGFTPAIHHIDGIESRLFIYNFSPGIKYSPLMWAFTRPYIKGMIGVLYGRTVFKDGYSRVAEDSYAISGEILGGIDFIILKRRWGYMAIFGELGWLDSSGLDFKRAGSIDVRGVLFRSGVSISF